VDFEASLREIDPDRVWGKQERIPSTKAVLQSYAITDN